MTFQVLVSTMHQRNFDLLKKMNIDTNAIVINQCDENEVFELEFKEKIVKWINNTDRGLSKSRNLALEQACADICIFADDDLIYIENYKNIISEEFKLNPKADVIAFKVDGIERKFKNYHSKPRKLNYITSMKVSSVEIAFKLDSVKNSGIRFNESFGAGAKYSSGEENIFLYDCLKMGLNIQYVPVKISDLHIGDSTWFKGFDREYFITKGAVFTAMSKLLSIPLIIQFALRKYKLYKTDNSIFLGIKYMLEGRKSFLNEVL